MFKRLTFNSVIITLTSWVLLTQNVFAQNTSVSGTQNVSLWSLNILDFINFVLATIANTALGIMNLWVAITGALFTVSINITLHIKDFVDNTQGIYLLWETIRDLSGIFIIFMLLYASIRIIIGKDEKIGPMIANIVIAGILINFSFFITSMLIDASNIVSVAIYKGIVATPQPALNKQTSIESLTSEALNGGADNSMSDIFMDRLQIQSVYKPGNTNISDSVGGASSVLVKTIIQGVVGCVIMFTAGMSFLVASIAFIMRLITLILLLGFSSIWFASSILPSLKEKSGEFTKLLNSQLIFMPVYMLLLYAAMTILKNSTIFNNVASPTGGNWQTGFIVLGVNDFIIIFLLNMPLAVGIAMSGHMSGMVKKWDATAVWKNVGKTTGSFAGRNTLGRLASSMDNSATARSIYSSNPLIGKYVSANLSKVSSAGFGGGKKAGFDQVRKQKTEDYKKLADKANLNADEQEQVDKFLVSGQGKLPSLVAGKKELYQNMSSQLNAANTEKASLEATKTALENKKKLLVEQQNTIREQLQSTTKNIDKVSLAAQSNAVGKQIEQAQEEIGNVKLKITQKETDVKSIADKAKNLPKKEITERWKTKKGRFGREVARAITKEKDPNAEIMATLKEIKDKEDKAK